MIKVRGRPELAWVLYTDFIHCYSQAAREAKLRDLPAAALLPPPRHAVARCRRSGSFSSSNPSFPSSPGPILQARPTCEESSSADRAIASRTPSPDGKRSPSEKQLRLGELGRRDSLLDGGGVPAAGGEPVVAGGSWQDVRRCMLPPSLFSLLEGPGSLPASPSQGPADPGLGRILDPLEYSSREVQSPLQLVASVGLQPNHVSGAEGPWPHRLAPVRGESLQTLREQAPLYP